MQKFQMIFQRIVIIGSVLLASLTIVYALGFSTNIFNLYYHTDPIFMLAYVPGAELYLNVQPFNRLLFNHSIFFFTVCLTMFITLTHRRRLYYISNYVTSLAFAGYAVFMGYMLWNNARDFKSEFLSIDFEVLQSVKRFMRMDYSDSTFMFDAGLVLAVVLTVFAGLLVVNLVLKIMWQSREKWLPARSGTGAGTEGGIKAVADDA
jgi:hypothetical protein